MNKNITLKELYTLYKEMPEVTPKGDILINFTIYYNNELLCHNNSKVNFRGYNIDKIVITNVDTALNINSLSEYVNYILDYYYESDELEKLNVYNISVYCKD